MRDAHRRNSPLGKNHLDQGEGVFVICALTRITSRETALRYDGLASGATVYAYVGGDPLDRIDPYGLWQFTITGDLGLGALVTFGYNSGQFNIGAYVGLGEGASGSLNLDDSGCHQSGAWRGTRADGRLGIGAVGADVSATVGPGVNTSEVTGQVPGVRNLNVGFSTDGNQVNPAPTVNIVAGESAFLGYGGQIYF